MPFAASKAEVANGRTGFLPAIRLPMFEVHTVCLCGWWQAHVGMRPPAPGVAMGDGLHASVPRADRRVGATLRTCSGHTVDGAGGWGWCLGPAGWVPVCIPRHGGATALLSKAAPSTRSRGAGSDPTTALIHHSFTNHDKDNVRCAAVHIG